MPIPEAESPTGLSRPPAPPCRRPTPSLSPSTDSPSLNLGHFPQEGSGAWHGDRRINCRCDRTDVAEGTRPTRPPAVTNDRAGREARPMRRYRFSTQGTALIEGRWRTIRYPSVICHMRLAFATPYTTPAKSRSDFAGFRFCAHCGRTLPHAADFGHRSAVPQVEDPHNLALQPAPLARYRVFNRRCARSWSSARDDQRQQRPEARMD
jgi:hypothetical protein